MRVATWNVLTLAHTGYSEAIVSELLNYRVSLAGLTETRLVDNGVQYIDSCTLLRSGGSSHINGVALLLDKRLSGSLVSWSPISDLTDCYALVWFTNMVICQ